MRRAEGDPAGSGRCRRIHPGHDCGGAAAGAAAAADHRGGPGKQRPRAAARATAAGTASAWDSSWHLRQGGPLPLLLLLLLLLQPLLVLLLGLEALLVLLLQEGDSCGSGRASSRATDSARLGCCSRQPGTSWA